MTPPSFLLRGGSVLTCDPEIPDLYKGDVLVRNGRIAAVGEALPHGDAEIIDAAGLIVLPGLIDAHQHLWEAPYLVQQPDMELATYFSQFVGGAASGLTPDGLFDGTKSALTAALQSGTTTTFDWCHATNSVDHCEASLSAAAESGARYVFGYGPPVALGYYGSPTEHPPAMETLVGRHGAKVNDRVGIAAALRGPDLSPVDVTDKEIQRARAIGLPISMHIATRRAGPGGISALQANGLLGPDLQFVHVTDASNDELAMVADAGAQIVIPPIAELSMGTGFPPLRRLADSHSHFGLGVDSVLGSPPDMFSQMRLAAGLLRAGEWTAGEPPAGSRMTSVLAAATIGGAKACWMDDETGSLTPGKSADVLLFRPSRAVETLAEAYGQVIWMGNPSRLVSVRVAGEEMLPQNDCRESGGTANVRMFTGRARERS